ncbi:3-oxoacyl-[acyl-carrier protein] reductase [Thermocatellispora tengchongensis]|uniref:3-oxoacyl-[acyl-carrier protein] reductase n=1 Tax=Thermocatellispora tengchongensis TaxID=1073253 RepID=A0A840PE21_9ACTN|nr:SDR family oxidoreductase [Thermocatellispora tengchongensis]MBB5136091.1 3-oxoacyl-[acyl-carrier protein] reductase [Thermocatellispora tengchongensis]
MDLGLTGRVALVAAASSGLGLGVARALAREGAHVSIAARDPGRLARAHAEVDAAGPGKVLSTPVDLRDDDAVTAWVERTAAELGALHVVVTNSGGVPHGPADAFTPGQYREALEGSMLPHVTTALAALPHLRAAGWGRILMITSEAVRQPLPGTALSASARLGLLGFAKGLVHALGASGVTVNVLAPGCHRTPAFETFLEAHPAPDKETALKEITAEIPLGTVGDPEDFGAIAAFLAGEQASFVTGTVLVADGGNTRGLG